MPDTENKEPQEGDTKPPVAPAPTAPAKKLSVTSIATIDFPSIGWGINAGEQRELPDDPAAQAIILANANITKVN